MTDKPVMIDHLDVDPPIRDQAWWCVSFLSPEGIKNCRIRGLKHRGTFATRAEADARAKEIKSFDKDFNVFVGEVGKWLAWDPDPNSIEDNQYQEEQLNDLMKAYKDNRTKVAETERERRETMKKNATINEQTRKSDIQERLKKKLEERKKEGIKMESHKTDIENNIEKLAIEIKNNEKTITEEHDETVKLDTEIRRGENELKKVEDNIKQLKSQYRLLTEKDK